MRKTLAVITLALSLIPAISQAQLRMAILGGPQKSTVDEKNSLPGWEETIKPGFTSRNGLRVGMLIEVPISSNGKWFLHPGIQYSTKEANLYLLYCWLFPKQRRTSLNCTAVSKIIR